MSAMPVPGRARPPGGLRARRDLVVDEVGVQRAVGLVRDEVGDEEDRHRGGEDASVSTTPVTARLTQAIGVAATRNGSRPPIDVLQPVRPAADDERQPERQHALDGDQAADDAVEESRNSLAATGDVGRDDRDREREGRRREPEDRERPLLTRFQGSTSTVPGCSQTPVLRHEIPARGLVWMLPRVCHLLPPPHVPYAAASGTRP